MYTDTHTYTISVIYIYVCIYVCMYVYAMHEKEALGYDNRRKGNSLFATDRDTVTSAIKDDAYMLQVGCHSMTQPQNKSRV